jgi:hypothetical protein
MKMTATNGISDELKACEQIVDRLSTEEAALLTRASRLKSDLAGRRSLEPAGDAEKIARIEHKTLNIDRRLAEISPQVRRAEERCKSLLDEQAVVRQSRMQAEVRAAMSGMASHAVYLCERKKLEDLKEKLTFAKAEMARLRELRESSAVPTREELVQGLIDTGDLPPDRGGVSSRDIRRAFSDASVLEQAVQIQQANCDRSRTVFADELIAAIEPLKAGIVQRIALGYGEAAAATSEAAALRRAVELIAGVGAGQHFTFAGVNPVSPDRTDPFSSWLRENRIAGRDV